MAQPDNVRTLPERAPEVGELVQVRSRRWLVQEVTPSETPGRSPLVTLACADDVEGRAPACSATTPSPSTWSSGWPSACARFRAQGFVHHDLSRACFAQAHDSIPRVVLLARLCLYGRRARRRAAAPARAAGRRDRRAGDAQAARTGRARGPRPRRDTPPPARAHRRRARPPRGPVHPDRPGLRRRRTAQAPVEHALLAHAPRPVRPRPGAGAGRIRAFYEVQAKRVEPVGLVYLWPETN